MKAVIVDPNALRSLKPLDLASYLRTRGWTVSRHIGDLGAEWASDDGQDEVLAPADPDLRDFPQRIGELLMTLSVKEKRSQLEIFRDIGSSTSDIIRVRAIDPDYDQGTMPVSEAVVLMEKARDLVFAAACSAFSPRPVFNTRKPAKATDYIKDVRMGQTEIGSFVVTMQSPVPPDLRENLPGTPVSEPFERRVTRTLTTALAATERAARIAASSGSMAAFEEAQGFGVSANLCDALIGLYESSRAQALGVGVSWAPVRPMTDGLVQSLVTIQRDALPILKEVSRNFKARFPERAVEIVGYVVKLERGEGAEVGRVTVFGNVRGQRKSVRVRMDLSGAEYDLALLTHFNGQVLEAAGELIKEGRQFVLKNVRALNAKDAIEEDDLTEDDDGP